MKQNQKPCTKLKKVIDIGKRNKTLGEVKLQDHAYEYQNPFELKEDSLSQRNCQNQLSHPGLSHTEQKCQESLIKGKIHNQLNSNKGLEYS